MKLINVIVPLTAAGFLLANHCALAQFSGYFSGYYAPTNWTSTKYNNPLYQSTAFIYSGNAPGSLEIDGAVNATQQSGIPLPPASIVDYTITLSGSGLQPVAFYYSFSGLAVGGYDAAYLIYDSGSGLQQVATLSSLLDGTQQYYFNNSSFLGGHTFGFRVYSNNDNLADTLVITVVPEPSGLTLLGLGASGLFWGLRWRKQKS